MVARIGTVAFHGVEVQSVDVEVSISNGLPNFTIVGSNYPQTKFFALKIIVTLLFLVASTGTVAAQTKINDVSRLNETVVSEIRRPVNEQDIGQAIRDGMATSKKVSIAGRKHSQGGHIMADDAIVLDMTGFNKIIGLNPEKTVLKVQSGATWAQIQDYLNAYGLSVKVQQSSNIFTVGGSLSANVHGRDPRYGSIIDTVRSFRLVAADGRAITASRTENSELFSLVIGGYGLFGVITEVELDVIKNSTLKKSTVTMNCNAYPAFLKKDVWNNPDIEIHYARPDITRQNFMKECLVTSYARIADSQDNLQPLIEEKLVDGAKWLLDMSRKSDVGKSARWFIQESLLDEAGAPEIISRNNAMRPPVKFLDYVGKSDTDILQEYFVPLNNSVQFMDDLRQIVIDNNINVLSVTLRAARKDTESFMPYAAQDSIAFVLYINHGTDKASVDIARSWTRKLIDSTLRNEGTYYLTYANYATLDQLKKAYPATDQFFTKKEFYDPASLFMNKFYEQYKGYNGSPH